MPKASNTWSVSAIWFGQLNIWTCNACFDSTWWHILLRCFYVLFQLFLVDFFGSRLVGSVEHFLFFHILGIILLFDFHIFFRGVAPPPTSIYIYMITYGISPVVWNIPNYIYIYTYVYAEFQTLKTQGTTDDLAGIGPFPHLTHKHG